MDELSIIMMFSWVMSYPSNLNMVILKPLFMGAQMARIDVPLSSQILQPTEKKKSVSRLIGTNMGVPLVRSEIKECWMKENQISLSRFLVDAVRPIWCAALRPQE